MLPTPAVRVAPSYPTSRRPIAIPFRRTAEWAANECVRRGVHPDVISWSSVGVAAVAAAAYGLGGVWLPLWFVAPLLGYVRLWLNMLDGMVAVAGGRASRRGEVINELPDRISDILIFAAVAHGGLNSMALGYAAAVGAVLTAYVGVLGQAVGAGRQFGGLMSKPWRMVALHAGAWTTLALVWATGTVPTIGGLTPMDGALVVVVLGCVQTCGVRVARTLRILGPKEPS